MTTLTQQNGIADLLAKLGVYKLAGQDSEDLSFLLAAYYVREGQAKSGLAKAMAIIDCDGEMIAKAGRSGWMIFHLWHTIPDCIVQNAIALWGLPSEAAAEERLHALMETAFSEFWEETQYTHHRR